tara:strand:- start:401 stop:625 length:225 start_codon:yes stop_codon:yes gene_type:complete
MSISEKERFNLKIRQIKRLLHQAYQIVPDVNCDKAYESWYKNIVTSLDSIHCHDNKSKYTMRDTYKDWILEKDN